ncbi:hypothetical protein FKM82_002418 [Ascaphus truei]
MFLYVVSSSSLISPCNLSVYIRFYPVICHYCVSYFLLVTRLYSFVFPIFSPFYHTMSASFYLFYSNCPRISSLKNIIIKSMFTFPTACARKP